MNEKDTIELVNNHAEALIQGNGLGLELAEHDLPTSQLLTVASRVKSALRPITPRADFVRDLKQQLVREAHQQESQRQQLWIMLVATAGGLIYGLGVLALGLRTSMWVLGLVALAMGWKRRQPVKVKSAS